MGTDRVVISHLRSTHITTASDEKAGLGTRDGPVTIPRVLYKACIQF